MNNEQPYRYEHKPLFIVRRDGQVDRRTIHLPSSTLLEIEAKAKLRKIKSHVLAILNRVDDYFVTHP